MSPSSSPAMPLSGLMLLYGVLVALVGAALAVTVGTRTFQKALA
ncbi:hypothetical protein ACF09E_16950 [Streptomyces sp. NPDC014891]